MEKISENGTLAFNLLGLLFFASMVFVALFGVAGVVAESMPLAQLLALFLGLLLPAACFTISFGFKKKYRWAWYAATLFSGLMLTVGVVEFAKLSAAGLIPCILAVCILLWLFKVRKLYLGLHV